MLCVRATHMTEALRDEDDESEEEGDDGRDDGHHHRRDDLQDDDIRRQVAPHTRPQAGRFTDRAVYHES